MSCSFGYVEDGIDHEMNLSILALIKVVFCFKKEKEQGFANTLIVGWCWHLVSSNPDQQLNLALITKRKTKNKDFGSFCLLLFV